MSVESELIDAVERALISWFDPPLNGQKAPHDEALRARGNALKDMRLRVELTREHVAVRCNAALNILLKCVSSKGICDD